MASPLLAYSFLRAQYGENVRSPTDVVVPLVKRAFFRLGKPLFENSEIQQRILATWGIEIPIHVIRYAYGELQRDGVLTFDTATRRLRLVDTSYVDPKIKGAEEDARASYTFLRQCIDRTLIDEGYGEGYSAEVVLEDWLDRSSLGFFGEQTAFSAGPLDHEYNRIVHLALHHPATGDKFLTCLAEAALGDSIFRAVKAMTEFESDDLEADLKRRMDGVSVYFDTKILLRFLGYSGAEHQKAATELVTLCRQTGCTLKAFDHTVDEMSRIFLTVASKIAYSGDVTGDIASYALTHGLSAADLIDQTSNLGELLATHGFVVEPAPRYEEALGIDENALSERLRIDLNQGSEQARVDDVASITAIYRLRGGHGKEYLESCDAILVTANKGLMDSTSNYFRGFFKEYGTQNRVQLCMTDVVLSSRLWTKLPTASVRVPREDIVSHVLGNLRPRQEVVANFFEFLKEFGQKNAANAEVAAAVQISRFTRITLSEQFPYSQKSISANEAVEVINKIITRTQRARKEALEAATEEQIAPRLRELDEALFKLQAEQSLELSQQEAKRSELLEARAELANLSSQISQVRTVVGRIVGAAFFVVTVLLMLSLVGVLGLGEGLQQWLEAHTGLGETGIWAGVFYFSNLLAALVLAVTGLFGLALTGIKASIEKTLTIWILRLLRIGDS